ncbi:MAG: DUF1579 domain-containing protein [Pedobacter sp.]|nr:MAG: DUF1579 domain-containing protein [Pedobacter sp.]
MEPKKSKFELSLENGQHQKLSLLQGSWEGTSRVWFEKDVLTDESPVSGTITPILEGRFLLHQYKTSMAGKSIEGVAIIGYSFDDEKFQTAWVDSFHMGTGIMLSQGDATANGHSVLGSYGAATMPEPWGWRTEIEVVNKDHIVITAYNIQPGEEEQKATEIAYKRK